MHARLSYPSYPWRRSFSPIKQKCLWPDTLLSKNLYWSLTFSIPRLISDKQSCSGVSAGSVLLWGLFLWAVLSFFSLILSNNGSIRAAGALFWLVLLLANKSMIIARDSQSSSSVSVDREDPLIISRKLPEVIGNSTCNRRKTIMSMSDIPETVAISW